MLRTKPVNDERSKPFDNSRGLTPPATRCRRVAARHRNASATIALLLMAALLLLSATHASEIDSSQPSNSPLPAAAANNEVSEKSPASTSDAHEANSAVPQPQPMPPIGEAAKKPAAPKLAPEKYRDVDDAARLLIWLVVSCGLGGLLLLMVIVLGAKRIRRLTRSQMLKSKYDELEFLRLKHRREVEGLAQREPPKTEIR